MNIFYIKSGPCGVGNQPIVVVLVQNSTSIMSDFFMNQCLYEKIR